MSFGLHTLLQIGPDRATEISLDVDYQVYTRFMQAEDREFCLDNEMVSIYMSYAGRENNLALYYLGRSEGKLQDVDFQDSLWTLGQGFEKVYGTTEVSFEQFTSTLRPLYEN